MAGEYRVVVGVDGSPVSIRALRWALAEAAARGGSVLAVTAWGWADVEGDGAVDLDALEAQTAAALARVVAEARAAVPGVPVEPETLFGRAVDVLPDAARGADLLVVGSHGRGRMLRALLGSVADACLRARVGPVVVLPADPADAPPAG
jgi:nucleotide-binding universal stress UspA family protein